MELDYSVAGWLIPDCPVLGMNSDKRTFAAANITLKSFLIDAAGLALFEAEPDDNPVHPTMVEVELMRISAPQLQPVMRA